MSNRFSKRLSIIISLSAYLCAIFVAIAAYAYSPFDWPKIWQLAWAA